MTLDIQREHILWKQLNSIVAASKRLTIKRKLWAVASTNPTIIDIFCEGSFTGKFTLEKGGFDNLGEQYLSVLIGSSQFLSHSVHHIIMPNPTRRLINTRMWVCKLTTIWVSFVILIMIWYLVIAYYFPLFYSSFTCQTATFHFKQISDNITHLISCRRHGRSGFYQQSWLSFWHFFIQKILKEQILNPRSNGSHYKERIPVDHVHSLIVVAHRWVSQEDSHCKTLRNL